ncbi:MAG: hypothetical protein Q4E61_04415 [Alphaproteobacteria bacterium]|nr:hypothetical protein [Alphaproteobacteria bacterium]
MPKKGELKGKYIKCECCEKEVYKTSSQYNKAEHHFCSNKCQKIYEHKLAYEFRKCEICGEFFETSKKSTQKLCSNKCQNIWQTYQTGKLNKRNKRIDYNCDFCKKDIEILPCEQKLFSHHFCSNECRQKWYAEVFSQNEEWKNESQKRALKLLENQSVNTNTKPQIITNNLLDSLDISYINEKNFTYYSVDNYLPDYNLIIEVNGDYWHSSPLFYEYNSLNDVQKNRIPKDKAKHTYIKNNYGIEILYLWEYDLINNKDLCKKLIQLYIDNNGLLNNYHSFNYVLQDNELNLTTNIITPFQDIKLN